MPSPARPSRRLEAGDVGGHLGGVAGGLGDDWQGWPGRDGEQGGEARGAPGWTSLSEDPYRRRGKLSSFVTLLDANKLHVAVVIDSSSDDVGAVKRLHENGQLGRRNLVELRELTGTRDADIEDLFPFPPDF